MDYTEKSCRQLPLCTDQFISFNELINNLNAKPSPFQRLPRQFLLQN